MAVDINTFKFLIDARKTGISFDSILTVGRQHLNVYANVVGRLLKSHGFVPSSEFGPNLSIPFAEPALVSLGARRVASIDASSYEGATHVHDLNQPIEQERIAPFDLVLDAGTLEHVFNLPVALKNCMQLVKPGGHLILHTCANNWCGHGFYQFSPELFYRTLSPSNGFKIVRMILHRVGPYARWYEIDDPEHLRGRLELVTVAPMQLLVLAKRVTEVPIFAVAPQQSDYVRSWAAASHRALESNAGKLNLTVRLFPEAMRCLHVLWLGLQLLRTHTLMNRQRFRPVVKP